MSPKFFLNKRGNWEDPNSPYLPKYKSTYWQIMILGHLGIDKENKRVQRACWYTLNLQLDGGGFSAYTKERALEEYEWMQTRAHLKEKLQPAPKTWARSLVFEHQYSCLTGNVCAAMLRIGYGKDSRVVKALDWLAKIQNRDGARGGSAPTGWHTSKTRMAVFTEQYVHLKHFPKFRKKSVLLK